MQSSPMPPSARDGSALDRLLRDALAAFDALTPAQQEDHRRRQRESWLRGEIGLRD